MLAGLEAAELPADAIEVGRIADAWGLKGWFKVLPYSADPQALFSSRSWFLLPAQKGQRTFSGVGKLSITESRMHADTVVASAHDLADRDAAQALRGARVFVARASFPAAKSDEFYWVDLIGLSVVNRDGLGLGRVKELISTGLQTLLVLAEVQEGKTVERMIPFVGIYVDQVDLLGRRILVDWQPDY